MAVLYIYVCVYVCRILASTTTTAAVVWSLQHTLPALILILTLTLIRMVCGKEHRKKVEKMVMMVVMVVVMMGVAARRDKMWLW